MKRLAVLGMVLLGLAFTAVGCASQSSGQWDVNWNYTNSNWQNGAGGGNGLF